MRGKGREGAVGGNDDWWGWAMRSVERVENGEPGRKGR